jgi:hypothetical protein
VNLCNEAWQGEISTILPLEASERQLILETANSWKLADLDVSAFSYTPVPHTLESRLQGKESMASQVSIVPLSYFKRFKLPTVSHCCRNKDVSTRPSLGQRRVRFEGQECVSRVDLG